MTPSGESGSSAEAESEYRVLPKLAGVIEPGQHGLDLPPQRRVAAACLGDERIAARRIALAGGMEDLGDLMPTSSCSFMAAWQADARLSGQTSVEPRAGRLPLPLHRGDGEAQHVPGLFERQPAKKAQLGDLTFPGIERRQFDSAHDRGPAHRPRGPARCATSSSSVTRAHRPDRFAHVAGPGPVHQDAAHHLRRDAKELRAVLPGGASCLTRRR